MPHDIFAPTGQAEKMPFRRNRQTQWVEDAYIAGAGKEDYISSSFDIKKLRIIFFIVIALFSVLLARVTQLQLVRGQEYRQAAEENRIRLADIKAPRGIIYDQNGAILAHNVPNFALLFTPADLPKDATQRSELLRSLADALEIDPAILQKTIDEEQKDSYQSFILYDHIPYEKAIPLRIATGNASGITFDTITFREYTTDSSFSHLLGYMGKATVDDLAAHPDYSYDDYIGKDGIELSHEDILKGVNGKKEIEVNALGKESKVITQTKATGGANLTLTIDKQLQETLGQSLDAIVSGSKSITGAAAVAIDVNTGGILAITSSPAYNSNAMTLGLTSDEYQKLLTDPKKPFINRPISGEYPSGSTIKPVIAAAVLQEGVITPQTTVMSTGGIRIDKWFFPDWKAGGHGLTDVRKALAESVNTFFYIAGGGDGTNNGLGVDRMTAYMRLFGLGDKLGVDLPGEATGFVPSKEWKEETKGEPWYIGDTYHLAIGQGDLLVTPLQVATYTATIANGGTFYRPHLIKSYSDASNMTTEISPIIIRNNFIKSEYIQVVREGLRQGVTSGSSRALADLAVTSAAKTGTAQFGDNKTHAWFTCFAPYEHPQIAITVIVENGGEGNAVALPVAKEALKDWFSRHQP